MKFRTLPPNALDKLVRDGRSIYVLNTSKLPSGDKGMIVINVFDGTRREFFKAPPTYIPMCVTDAIPPNRLIESRDFRQSLLKGMLTLVDPDQAEDYLSTKEAKEEYDNLVLSEHSSRSRSVNVEAEVAKRMKVSHSSSESFGPADTSEEATESVSNRVRGLVEDMVSGTKQTKDVLNELKRHQDALKPIDLSYVMANATDGELSKWAKKVLSTLTQDTTTPAPKMAKVKKSEVPLKEKKSPGDFDFDSQSEMSAEEAAADARAQSKYLGQQALSGQSKIDEEINKMLGGS